jgi:hypothetical protein
MDRLRHEPGLDNRADHRGVILLVTLVILVILSTLAYTLCVQVAARRHRDQYVIDYCIARNACTSGLKLALASMSSLQFQLISRPNEPDFSDLFALPEPQYQMLLAQTAAQLTADGNGVPGRTLTEPIDRETLKKGTRQDAGTKSPAKDKDSKNKAAKKDATEKALQESAGKAALARDTNDVSKDINDVNDFGTGGPSATNPNSLQVRGPYGPPWPLATERTEVEIGSAKVTIEVEDENAKYPLGWAMLADEKRKPVAVAGWTTFCEWMGYTPQEIGVLNEDLAKIGKAKPFKTEFKQETNSAAAAAAAAAARSRITRPTPTTASTIARRTVPRKPVTVEEQIDDQNKEYARLLHSSLINRDLLARPSLASDTRKESALKYLGLWATRHVNINTAPRQVLEAALIFGSPADAPKIAEAIIETRRLKPVSDVNELKQAVPRYAGAIDDCRTFLTTQSTVFTIRVTAVSGVARVTAVAAVTKVGDKIQPIAIISD